MSGRVRSHSIRTLFSADTNYSITRSSPAITFGSIDANNYKEFVAKYKWIDNSEDFKTVKESFSETSLPIYCVAGPHFSGKSTLAESLARASDYILLSVKNCLFEEMEINEKLDTKIRKNMKNIANVPDELVVRILMKNLAIMWRYSKGFVIDDFPINIKQGKLFEEQISPIKVVICLSMHLDVLLIRKVSKSPSINLNKCRIRHVIACNALKKVSRYYAKQKKIISTHSNYSPPKLIYQVLDKLNDFYEFSSKDLVINTE